LQPNYVLHPCSICNARLGYDPPDSRQVPVFRDTGLAHKFDRAVVEIGDMLHGLRFTVKR
jgi:hypothetical protein